MVTNTNGPVAENQGILGGAAGAVAGQGGAGAQRQVQGIPGMGQVQGLPGMVTPGGGGVLAQAPHFGGAAVAPNNGRVLFPNTPGARGGGNNGVTWANHMGEMMGQGEMGTPWQGQGQGGGGIDMEVGMAGNQGGGGNLMANYGGAAANGNGGENGQAFEGGGQGAGAGVQRGIPPGVHGGGKMDEATVLVALDKEVAKGKANGERLKKEFTWQRDYGGDKWDAIKEDTLSPQRGIRAFGVVVKTSTVIKVMYGIGKYIDAEGPMELTGKVIGFLGERTKHGAPVPFVLPRDNAWKWNEKVKLKRDPVAWATWHGNAGNKQEFWAPTGQATDTALPRMISLPAVVARYAAEKPRTAKEVYDYIDSLVAEEDSVLDEETVDFVKTWLLAAGQKEVGKSVTGVALDIQAAVSADEGFGDWVAGMLDAVLGTKVEQAQVQQMPMAAGTPMGMGMAYNNGMMEQILLNQNELIRQQTAETARVQAAERAKKSETRDPYTIYELCRAFGWCHVDQVEQLPPLWADLLTSKATDDHRTLIMARLQEWSVEAGIKIDPGLYLTKDQVKDIVELKLGKGGMIGLLSMAEQGLSNLGALPRSYAEIEAIKQFEEKEEKAKATMTISDYAKKDGIKATRAPPSNYNELQANVGTTLGLVAITCGTRSSVFNKLLELHQILQGGYVQAIQALAYTPNRCRQYSWAIYEAMRAYFSVELTPDKFGPQAQFINYPRLLIDDVAAKMQHGEMIFRPTYPVSWRTLDIKERDNGGGKEQQNYQRSGGGSREYGGMGGGDRGVTGGGGMGGAYGGGATGGYSGGAVDSTAHVHPRVAEVMRPVWKAHGKAIGISALCQGAGISTRTLPYLKRMINQNGKNTLCYTYLCGECRWGEKCHFAHVAGRELEGEFVDEFVEKIKPGAAFMKTQQPRKRGAPDNSGSGGGSPNKFVKKEPKH